MSESTWVTIRWWLVFILLAPLYIVFMISSYWWFVDRGPPIVVTYQHPYFLDTPANSRDEAFRHSIYQIRGGSQVWIYREFCVTKPVHGSVKSHWVGTAFVWPSPERAIPAYKVGCYNDSSGLTTPTSSPSRDLVYTPIFDFHVNPLVDVDMQLDGIKLRILSVEDAMKIEGRHD